MKTALHIFLGVIADVRWTGSNLLSQHLSYHIIRLKTSSPALPLSPNLTVPHRGPKHPISSPPLLRGIFSPIFYFVPCIYITYITLFIFIINRSALSLVTLFDPPQSTEPPKASTPLIQTSPSFLVHLELCMLIPGIWILLQVPYLGLQGWHAPSRDFLGCVPPFYPHSLSARHPPVTFYSSMLFYFLLKAPSSV